MFDDGAGKLEERAYGPDIGEECGPSLHRYVRSFILHEPS